MTATDSWWISGSMLAIAWFAVGEAFALRHPQRAHTLSRFVYTIGARFPLSIWLMGVFAGILAAHFFWHWCPAGSISIGLLR